MLRTRNPIVTAAVALISLAASHVDAAPQILGLVASNGMPTPLHCQDGFCIGYFASFCLQEARDAAATGHEYKLARGGGLTLIATQPDGGSLRLPANDLLTIRLRSGFSTVGVSLAEVTLDALGIRTLAADSLAVEVEPETTILPVVASDDANPQSPEEIAQAIGPLRHLAAEMFDRSGVIPDAARLVGLLINALPPEHAPGLVAIDSLFRQVLARVGSDRLGAEGVAEAERIAKRCQRLVNSPTSFALGACLDREQVSLLATLNNQFWVAAGGS
jgi:hypothetical protein